MEICKITPARRADDAAWLAEMVAAYQGPVVEAEGFTDIAPLPARSGRIEPEYKLRRTKTPTRIDNLPRIIAALSVTEIDGREDLRSASEVAALLRKERGMWFTAEHIAYHAERAGIVLRQPGQSRRQPSPAPKATPLTRRTTRQAREREVLREVWP